VERREPALPVADVMQAVTNVAARPEVAPKWATSVYSESDTDVIPPLQTYPRLVEPLAPDHPNASPVLVVIDESGVVESAILARRPADMRQAVSGTLLLSAAKAARFQPATKNGQPVKYRCMIWFSNQ
jgi:hypothetical protein